MLDDVEDTTDDVADNKFDGTSFCEDTAHFAEEREELSDSESGTTRNIRVEKIYCATNKFCGFSDFTALKLPNVTLKIAIKVLNKSFVLFVDAGPR